MLGLLHGDLVDMGERPGSRGSLDGFHGDLLYLSLRLFELFFEGSHLSRLPRQIFFESLDAELGQAFIGLAVLAEKQYSLFELLLSGPHGLSRGTLGFLPEPDRKLCRFFAQALDLFFAGLQSRFALAPTLFQYVLLFLVGS